MSQDLLQIIKKAAMDAVETSNPMRVVFGTIESVSPLKVKIEQKLSIDDFFLIQTDTFKRYTDKKIGDKLVLIRMQGGQQYLILDRM
ncbi:DUF2577 domain-containing protein [Clostridioides difficile]|uniref:DUF2577 domain-containing protein n=1 Tax=Clostridioides difficile TaxID=1496 RepID=A0A9P3YSQ1_CLODI|nr:DUF2577 domain-containing protein [Clostridioides difficile]MCC0650894.1 DUF2577 domain-containing protein [Clostridioides sp. ZZV15-6598]MDB3118298.1 DUF2577 domain-containing protein [Clostridioides difficile]MDB3194371.1 DUF2577 domain-containing protein [Clostridioides difficile]MDB3326878.1 DUF2577 domain-containing protein [Clostridioides difficile]MDX5608007.1 DUF2577 domain-containing protein [Clostridioides difficile]